jgi:hypothetical protein
MTGLLKQKERITLAGMLATLLSDIVEAFAAAGEDATK